MSVVSAPPVKDATEPLVAKVGDARTRKTVQSLMDQAELLFAERGVGQVSLREIVKSSGQRNASVASYHFGSREALIVAVVERRMAVVDMHRNQYLDALLEQETACDVRMLMAAAVRPLAAIVQTTEWGARYTQIISELGQRPGGSPETQWNPKYLSAMDRIDQMVRRCLPDAAPAELQRRLRMTRGNVPFTLSAWVRHNGPVTAANTIRYRREVETLIDFMAGGVGADFGQRRSI